MTAFVMLLVIVRAAMIDGASGDSGSGERGDNLRLRGEGRGGVTSEAADQKSGSYGLERTLTD